jgi:hypothetical protein
MKFTKRTIAGAVGGTLLAGGAAFAAVTLFSSAHVAAAAAVPSALTVDGVQFTGTLLPGGSAGVKGVVHNPNNFPVSVTDVIVLAGTGTHGVGAGCGAGVLTIGGVPGGSYTINGSGDTAAGNKFTLASAVMIPANNGAEWVEIPAAVSQVAGSTALCGFEADIAVVATAGN